MDVRLFGPEDYPAIAALHNDLNIVWPERPRTAEGWAAADRNRNPKCLHRRWVAVEDGAVVGFGSYGQASVDYHPQRFYVNVEVAPAWQRRGIGAALYDQVMAALLPHDPRVLRADAFTNLPAGFRFLERRGFFEAFRETPVHLDIGTFDPAPYAAVESSLASRGIVIKTLRELEGDRDRDRRLYALYWETVEDVPQEDTRIEPPPFDEWVIWGLNDPTILPDAYFVAIHGDTYIGLRELGQDPDNNVLQGGMLGVRRDYRGRGIGLALQLRGISYARDHGYPTLKTCTAIQNAPMQAMFSKLGYRRDPEWLQCQKNL